MLLQYYSNQYYFLILILNLDALIIYDVLGIFFLSFLWFLIGKIIQSQKVILLSLLEDH